MRGIIYYNRGLKMAVRLAVSVMTLRDRYDGLCTILTQGEESKPICEKIAKWYDCEIIDLPWSENQKGQTFLNATRVHTITPYDTTLWMDSDTIVRDAFNPSAWWDEAEKNHFAVAQISNWTVQKKIAGRVKAWEPLYPDVVSSCLAIRGQAAINCGLFSFVNDSTFMRKWYGLAKPGRELSWIPDETCCQLYLHKFPHKIMDHWHNVSCKHDVPQDPRAQVIHYHGRKHCRKEGKRFLYGSELWYAEYDKIRERVKDWVRYDRQLRKHDDGKR